LALAGSYSDGLNSTLSNDLLSGRAGNLLGICHLYSCCEDPTLLDTIQCLIERIVSDACIAATGLKWDLYKNAYDSLTGFSHGASGIAFVLMELSRYFDALGLKYLAEQAFSYEMNYFDPENKNWMDLRVGVDRMNSIRQQFNKELLRWPLSAFQPSMSGISSWAHGAAGCGISRLSAFKITGEDKYASQALDAMEYSWSFFTQQKQIDYSLCSGYGGIAALFQLGASILQQPTLLDKSSAIALHAIDYYRKNDNYNSKLQHEIPDPGLFSGLAGVGYWLLGCLQDYESDTILLPGLPECTANLNNYSTTAIKRKIFTNYFKDSLSELAVRNPDAEAEMLNLSSDLSALENRLHEFVCNNGDDAGPSMKATFKSEQQLVHLWKAFNGSLRLRQNILILKEFIERCKHFQVHEWLKQTLVTVTHIEIIAEHDGEGQYVVYCSETGLKRIKVSVLAALILNTCRSPKLVENLVKEWQLLYFPGERKENIEGFITERIRELVVAGFLTAA
jgi:hypothetical protein